MRGYNSVNMVLCKFLKYDVYPPKGSTEKSMFLPRWRSYVLSWVMAAGRKDLCKCSFLHRGMRNLLLSVLSTLSVGWNRWEWLLMMTVSLDSILLSTANSTVSSLDPVTDPVLLMSVDVLCNDAALPAHISLEDGTWLNRLQMDFNLSQLLQLIHVGCSLKFNDHCFNYIFKNFTDILLWVYSE